MITMANLQVEKQRQRDLQHSEGEKWQSQNLDPGPLGLREYSLPSPPGYLATLLLKGCKDASIKVFSSSVVKIKKKIKCKLNDHHHLKNPLYFFTLE